MFTMLALYVLAYKHCIAAFTRYAICSLFTAKPYGKNSKFIFTT